MTREEAIKELKTEYLGDTEAIREAKDMAIKALSADTSSDLISRADALGELNGACSNWEDDAKVAEIINALPSAELPKGDLISRADAMGAVRKCVVESELLADWNKAMESAQELLSELPSAEAEWIPCSERLPSEDGFYIATCDGEICGEDQPFTGFAEFENRKWVDDEDDYQCVLAWMPLPKPYREDGE